MQVTKYTAFLPKLWQINDCREPLKSVMSWEIIHDREVEYGEDNIELIEKFSDFCERLGEVIPVRACADGTAEFRIDHYCIPVGCHWNIGDNPILPALIHSAGG